VWHSCGPSKLNPLCPTQILILSQNPQVLLVTARIVAAFSIACALLHAVRIPKGTIDVVLSYCHNTLNDTSLVDLLPYFCESGVGVISASVTSMGLFTRQVPWYLASQSDTHGMPSRKPPTAFTWKQLLSRRVWGP
jgi:hypothetical protein